MTPIRPIKLNLALLVLIVVSLSLTIRQTYAQQQPDPAQMQQMLSQQTSQIAAQAETIKAQATALADYHQQVTQMIQQSDAICVAAIEKKNPTKQVDPKTFVVSDRPTDGKGRGGR